MGEKSCKPSSWAQHTLLITRLLPEAESPLGRYAEAYHDALLCGPPAPPSAIDRSPALPRAPVVVVAGGHHRRTRPFRPPTPKPRVFAAGCLLSVVKGRVTPIHTKYMARQIEKALVSRQLDTAYDLVEKATVMRF